jgi:hypothetical protein
MTRKQDTVTPNSQARPPIQPPQEEGKGQAAAMEEERQVAVEAWLMGRKLGAARRRARATRIPHMHPGRWRTGR